MVTERDPMTVPGGGDGRMEVGPDGKGGREGDLRLTRKFCFLHLFSEGTEF